MSKVPAVLSAVVLAVVLGGGGYVFGRHSQQDTIDRQHQQLRACSQITTVMNSMVRNFNDVLVNPDDTEKLQKAVATQMADNAILEHLFGRGATLSDGLDQCRLGSR